MESVVFFDMGPLSVRFMEDKKAALPFSCVFKEKQLNALTAKELSPYKEASVISVFPHTQKIDLALLDEFKNLKLITTRSTGFDHIDAAYCKKRGIQVRNVPRYGEITVAEFTFGLLLDLTRKITSVNQAMKNGHLSLDNYIGLDLHGRTLGVIGTGTIGRHVIHLALSFGMKVLAYDLYPNEEVKKTGVEYVSLDDLYQQSEIITLHVPSTKENYHLLNAQAFAKMKQGVYIINTARGDLIETEALYEALQSGKIAGAGLDVLEHEELLIHDDIRFPNEKLLHKETLLSSLINTKLLQMENVLITPHTAFNSIDAIHRILATTLDNIKAFFEKKDINRVW
jgi:D-lactate dehydrogenase